MVPSPPSAAQSTPIQASCDVLVVDDSRTNLQVIGRRLAHIGYRCCLCASGAEALDRLQGRSFDLVLLDMVMPGMSGVTVLREIRAMQHRRHVPVLMITARSDPGAVVEALEAGADDHVTKPFEFDALDARMRRLITRAQEIDALRRSNEALDARVVRRAVEIGELRTRIRDMAADRKRLADSLHQLQQKVDQLTG